MSLLQLHVSTLLLPSSSSSRSCPSKRISAAINHIPKLILSSISLPKVRKTNLLHKKLSDHEITNTIQTKTNNPSTFTDKEQYDHDFANSDVITAKLWAILEEVSNRIEMHENIRDQRDNWLSLLLNSINMITLSATTMVALATSHGVGITLSHFPINLSSSLLFFAATGMLIVMNKIQPSQLVEEQRNATRLFKTLRGEIENFLVLGNVPTQKDVDIMMVKVLALDRAYPLALLGAMLEKFPEKYEPSSWWPKNNFQSIEKPFNDYGNGRNGWSQELDNEMREINKVVRIKDKEDYERLGNIALKLNKGLAISGPLLTGVATIGSAFSGIYPAAAVMAVVSGAAATVINTVEHGGQVGMIFEMYRNCGGFFELLEESTNYTLEESEMDKRENGEVFEMKVALKLGRSLSELKDLAKKSSSSRDENTFSEFASKLF
ncbi:Petal formation-expressed [Heracleum sosnowskyi]|uniref:Petal formation-expressed n=1 Tax=Heracleum sosnowskyi TaxID=360622 RepID=A0AAD8HX56_9APIA|nr:Petal formation-expressed [Heracleum sosnowskyi]